MQRIEIQHLGPVQNLNMEIKDFNLLIGEQAKVQWQKLFIFLEL